MPQPTLFHSRTSRLCTSLSWKEWAGYHAVRSYGICHEPEYVALRHAAGLIDVSPLFKYEVQGQDAARFLSRLTVRDITRLKIGRMVYLCWCDDAGKVIDDGTVARLDDEHFRLTAAEPSLAWLESVRHGYRVDITDCSERIGALALQGPTAREILRQLVDHDMDSLRYFGIVDCRLRGHPVWLSRTGYTGDLGYEIWTPTESAEAVYDAILEAGEPFGLLPTGLDAMDVARIEAGFIMNGVDYFSANHCLIETRMSTPYESGLGWTVNLDRDPFNGQAALRAEKQRGPIRKFVGLDLDWDDYAALHERHDLPPEICTAAWRDPVPVYAIGGKQVGQATSGAWSPTLKRNLALATVASSHADVGRELQIEITVEFVRHTIKATVVKKPFFDVPRKRAVVEAQ